MAPLVASFTMPVITPEPLWARSVPGINTATARIAVTETILNEIIALLLDNSPTYPGVFLRFLGILRGVCRSSVRGGKRRGSSGWSVSLSTRPSPACYTRTDSVPDLDVSSSAWSLVVTGLNELRGRGRWVRARLRAGGRRERRPVEYP